MKIIRLWFIILLLKITKFRENVFTKKSGTARDSLDLKNPEVKGLNNWDAIYQTDLLYSEYNNLFIEKYTYMFSHNHNK